MKWIVAAKLPDSLNMYTIDAVLYNEEKFTTSKGHLTSLVLELSTRTKNILCLPSSLNEFYKFQEIPENYIAVIETFQTLCNRCLLACLLFDLLLSTFV